MMTSFVFLSGPMNLEEIWMAWRVGEVLFDFCWHSGSGQPSSISLGEREGLLLLMPTPKHPFPVFPAECRAKEASIFRPPGEQDLPKHLTACRACLT